MATTKVTTDNIDLSADTTALEIPTGTSDQRPGYFTVEYLVVAGGGAGGGGGNGSGGGGGAGGYLASTVTLALGTTYTVTVGDGGAPYVNAYGRGSSGENSSISGFGLTTITAIGGGGGGYGHNAGETALSGGSGGGAGRTRVYTNNPGGTSTSGQGNDGGNVATDFGNNQWAGGGGGGSNTAGQDGVPNVGGNGGSGTSNSITGSSNTYAAGGGGGVWGAGDTPGTGGDSSAGNGGEGSGGATTGGNATDNTGSGAGGGGWDSQGGTGGSGVIILRYSDSRTATYTAGTGGAADSEATVGTDEKYIKITAGTGTIVFTGGASAVEGTLRENTTTGKMEVYTGAAGWRALQQTGQDAGITPSNNFTTNLWSYQAAPHNIVTGFQPDFVWIKDYQKCCEPHISFDSVRGTGEYLIPSSSNQEATNNTTLTSFNTTGFTLGTDTVGLVNYPGRGDYVGWSWKAGGNSNTCNKNGTGYASASAAGLTTGTITPIGSSVGTETGFSIIKYTANGVAGATIPHGLGAAPDLYIIKALDSVRNWIVGTWMIPNTQILQLDLSDAVATYDAWNSTYPDANNVTVSAANPVNASGDYIMYCFRSIPGYSQIGYYIGTDVASGNKIYTGFKPAWLLVRNISTTKYWYIIDNKRSTTNPRNKILYANTTDTEDTLSAVNFLDYGFEVVTTDSGYNDIGNQYLFMAFSE